MFWIYIVCFFPLIVSPIKKMEEKKKKKNKTEIFKPRNTGKHIWTLILQEIDDIKYVNASKWPKDKKFTFKQTNVLPAPLSSPEPRVWETRGISRDKTRSSAKFDRKSSRDHEPDWRCWTENIKPWARLISWLLQCYLLINLDLPTRGERRLVFVESPSPRFFFASEKPSSEVSAVLTVQNY